MKKVDLYTASGYLIKMLLFLTLLVFAALNYFADMRMGVARSLVVFKRSLQAYMQIEHIYLCALILAIIALLFSIALVLTKRKRALTLVLSSLCLLVYMLLVADPEKRVYPANLLCFIFISLFTIMYAGLISKSSTISRSRR